MLKTKIENIPAELKKLNNWVCWVGTDKTPKSPKNGKNSMSNNPQTWGTFKQAVKACDTFNFDGLGFMFGDSEYFGVDLDNCLQNVDFVDEFVETLGSYAELSKSGKGIHIICKGTLPEGNRRKNNVEMYDSGRYFICTGNIYNENYKEVVDCTDTIKILHSKYLPAETPKVEQWQRNNVVDLSDTEIIDKARNCQTGQLFNMLYQGQWQGVYQSQSEADLAFCNMLAFWTGRNAEQMDRIFRCSGLIREKWDKYRGSETYGNITINKAIANCTECYSSNKYDDDSSLAIAFFRNGTVTGDNSEKKTKHYDQNDTGNAHRLYDKYGNIIKYVFDRNHWYFWNGKNWLMDETNQIKVLADEICRDLKQYAYSIDDEKLQEKALRFASKSANSGAKEAFIKECRHLNAIPAVLDDFDAYPDFLNCQNGIINLRNGELIPHDVQFMMSKVCNSEYDIDHKEPTKWLQFLNDITDCNKELIEYIQRSIGYSLTGSIKEQCAYFLYGDGNNGKSTFIDTIADLLGSYSRNTQPETLMLQSRVGGIGGGANTEIARLKSARFVHCEESKDGAKLDEGLLKQLTGGSRVTCRFLYCEEFEYTPEFKIWIATNHKPIIRGMDFGIWRRIKLIPFEVKIPDNKVDKMLKFKLRDEFPQILAWAVEGCIKWQQDGLKEPESVLEATKGYKNEMDLIQTFLNECILIDHTSSEGIQAQALYNLYSKWAKENNEYEMPSKRFFNEISKKLPDKERRSKGNFYIRIRLTDYADSLIGKQYRIEDFK